MYGRWKGTGLAGIISVLAGAREVLVTDYPSRDILGTIEENVNANIPAHLRDRVQVQGHEWGELDGEFAREYAGYFTRILCADCLWMDGQHESLMRSMLHFLALGDEGARVWVIAGFHTGREKIAKFFDVVRREGLVVEDIWECDDEGNQRAWEEMRKGLGDVEERQRWLVVAILKWRNRNLP